MAEGGWAERWQGGLCPVGALGGLPIRGADFAASRPLDQLLTLPGVAVSLADLGAATRAWSAALGAPVALARSLEVARAALLAAAGVGPGQSVGVPVNATRALVEAVKGCRARPLFLPLDRSLALEPGPAAEAPVVWAQPVAGLGDRPLRAGGVRFVDHGETLPDLAASSRRAETRRETRASEHVETRRETGGSGHAETRPAGGPDRPGTRPTGASDRADATLWGLHLSSDPAEAGALIAFGPGAGGLAARVGARLADDGPDPARALAQLARLDGPVGLLAGQRRALEESWRGLREAAGLEMLPLASALAHGVAVRVPAESEPSTFLSYVRGENTPARWLPDIRPVHYAAVRESGPAWRSSAVHLASWLMVPVGPDYSPEEIQHAVLGVVKASDYLGVRWRADAARAASYARAMVERYGAEHDAYRPVFALDG